MMFGDGKRKNKELYSDLLTPTNPHINIRLVEKSFLLKLNSHAFTLKYKRLQTVGKNLASLTGEYSVASLVY